MRDTETNAVYFARSAIGDDVALGRRLGEELRTLIERVSDDKLAVLASIPPAYRKWMRANGYDPLDAWLDQRLTDIVLNRGRVSVPPELFEDPDERNTAAVPESQPAS